MKVERNKHLAFRVIEYGMKNDKFTLVKLKEDIPLNSAELQTVVLLYSTNLDSPGPNHLLHRIGVGIIDVEYMEHRLLPNAVFNYLDYEELVVARKNARQAFYLSWIAIGITLIIGVLQALIALNVFASS